jgi:SNF2 family DNA or RNA helicase
MLDLRFSITAGQVRLSCDPDSERQLQRLRVRFASGVSISSQSFDLDLDDLLVNVQELAAWPSEDSEIYWQPELQRMVEGNVADANILKNQIDRDQESLTFSNEVFDAKWGEYLREFQRRDLAKLLELQHGANFSVPGAGKTRVALASFYESRSRGESTRMLVVCPKSAFESWRVEAGAFYIDEPLRVAIMNSSSPPVADLVLINYERLPDACSSLIQWLRTQPAMLVLDEAHRMKLGPAGAWGRACLALGPFAARRLILSGTPAPNGARDLENLFSFVWPGLGRATVTQALEGGDLLAASTRLKPLFTRTTKAELDLPPVDTVVRRVDLPPLHRELYDALLGQLSGPRRGGEQDLEALGKIILYLLMAATSPALLSTGSSRYEPLPYRVPPLQAPLGSSLAELMRDLPHYELSPKYKEVLAIVSANATKGRKTLVWSTFVRSLKSLELMLARFAPALVHGGTQDRQEQINRFREDPDCLVLLSNPATLGEGVSLHQVCHDAVYVDRDFAAGRFLQSLDRIHRLGLPPDVRTSITVLVANHTIDELVELRLAAKLHFMGSVLDDPAVLQLGDLDEEPSVGAGLDSSDLQAITGYLRGYASA